MPRPEYPSDEKRRKTKPAIRVHTTWPNHPRYSNVYNDVELRGVVLGIWMVAFRAFASKTHDEVTLSAADLLAITGRSRSVDAAKVLRRACEGMAYTLRMTADQPARWVIGVRNFSRKQGLATQGAEVDSATTSASKSPSDSASASPKAPKGGVHAIRSSRRRSERADALYAAWDPETRARFDRFYLAYARHVAKAAAIIAWDDIGPPTPELSRKIESAASAQAENWRRIETPPDKIPHPASWLNGKRWDDELPASSHDRRGFIGQ